MNPGFISTARADTVDLSRLEECFELKDNQQRLSCYERLVETSRGGNSETGKTRMQIIEENCFGSITCAREGRASVKKGWTIQTVIHFSIKSAYNQECRDAN